MQSSLGGDCTIFSLRCPYDSGVLKLSHVEVKDGVSSSRDGGIVDKDSLEIDRVVNESCSWSMLRRLPYSSSNSSTRPSNTSSGEPTTDDGASARSCLHSWINSSMDMVFSIGLSLRRRWGSLGIAVTASRAATAGGIASGLWFLDTRCGWPLCWPRALVVWVEVAVLMGVRGGITTGAECVGAAGATGAGMGFDIACGVFSGSAGRFKGVRAGLAERTPIFSEELRRGDGEGEWRKGNDLGTIIMKTGRDRRPLVTNN